jgi:MFS family permease
MGGLYCDRAGRRPLFIISTAGMLVFFILQTVCSAQFALHHNKAAGNSVVAFLCKLQLRRHCWNFILTRGNPIVLYSAFYAIAYSPLITSYTLEILPFNLRAKGYTVFSFAVSASLVFNQYINPIALAAIAWKYYIVYCVWLAFELVFIYFFLVETRNRTLEETAV